MSPCPLVSTGLCYNARHSRSSASPTFQKGASQCRKISRFCSTFRAAGIAICRRSGRRARAADRPADQHRALPAYLTPLFVGRERSVAAVEEAMEGDRTILAIAQREQDADDVGPGELFGFGVEAHIQRVLKMPDGSTSIVVQGPAADARDRLRRGAPDAARPARSRSTAREEKTIAVEAMMRAMLSLFEKVVKLSRTLPDDSTSWR
ncbi:MAG: LON peptidase substrate-binding domain-containing protein [Kouleothrix sp.]|nr:LON peptidase substrate-binding domain-containing protein [Kouleothrix sp.]